MLSVTKVIWEVRLWYLDIPQLGVVSQIGSCAYNWESSLPFRSSLILEATESCNIGSRITTCQNWRNLRFVPGAKFHTSETEGKFFRSRKKMYIPFLKFDLFKKSITDKFNFISKNLFRDHWVFSQCAFIMQSSN